MTPRCYLDFWPVARDGVNPPVIMSGVMSILHGYFRAHPGGMAIALPNYDTDPFLSLRVFAESTLSIDALVANISRHPKIRDYTKMGQTKTVPETWRGKWVEFRRFRIPTKKAGVDQLRAKRQAMLNDLPFFSMRSQSTGQTFILPIEKISIKEQLTSDGSPDSYGLSRLSNRVILPDI